jgi:hypothetical protein
LGAVERTSGNYVILDVINPNIHLDKMSLAQKAMVVPKGTHLSILDINKKVEDKRYKRF